ncbi:AAA family ATPase [Candidatus Fermentibacteria bacterium]|nr:AAA family ATPase [Candidatus Fermentibacteria bacterium]
MTDPSDRDAPRRCLDACQAISAQVHKVIVGQEAVVQQLLACLLANGHSLVVGVPGLAKTLTVSALARAMDLSFGRIQFTPDLMPSDITGTEVLEQDHRTGMRSFRFVHGPLFANIVLADEVNRTPPKTQAALLQAMQEREVTSGGVTYPLPPPFLVLATQNPIEQEGTYPLPEAQLDRFMFQVDISYPTWEDEVLVVEHTTGDVIPQVDCVIDREQVVALQAMVRRVPVARHVVEAAVHLARLTRPASPEAPSFVREWVRWGAGVRAGQYAVLGAKARALMQGKPTPDSEDLRAVAVAALAHRLVLTFRAEADGVTQQHVVRRLLEEEWNTVSAHHGSARG